MKPKRISTNCYMNVVDQYTRWAVGEISSEAYFISRLAPINPYICNVYLCKEKPLEQTGYCEFHKKPAPLKPIEPKIKYGSVLKARAARDWT